MCDRRGWGLLCVLGLVCLNACGDDDESSSKPDAGADASHEGESGSSGSKSAGSGGSGGTGGSGTVVPARGCPLKAPTRAELGSKLEPITSAAGARALHMTAKGLFWTTFKGKGIYQLQSDGSAAQVAQDDALPKLLTSNATQLAWLGSSQNMFGIWTMPLDGGSSSMPTRVTATNIFVEALALDEAQAYFGGSASDGLVKVPLAGGTTATKLAQPFGVNALAVDGGFAYYVESLGESVMRVAVAGGTPESASRKIGMIAQVVIDDSAIYATTLLSIYRIERGDPTAVKVLMPIAHPTSGDSGVTRLLDDGERLVFADQLENIGWVSKDGKTCGYIVTEGKTQLAGARSDIALDAKYLYVTDATTETLSRIKREDIGLAQ